MNRGSSPSYSWTNHDVRWVGGVLTVTLDDGNSGDPAFRDWCWNMDEKNEEAVQIFYTQLGARERELGDAANVVGGSAVAPPRQAQAIGPWLNPYMCPVIRSGSTLPPAMSLAEAYNIAPGTSCWDSPPWSPVGGTFVK